MLRQAHHLKAQRVPVDPRERKGNLLIFRPSSHRAGVALGESFTGSTLKRMEKTVCPPLASCTTRCRFIAEKILERRIGNGEPSVGTSIDPRVPANPGSSSPLHIHRRNRKDLLSVFVEGEDHLLHLRRIIHRSNLHKHLPLGGGSQSIGDTVSKAIVPKKSASGPKAGGSTPQDFHVPAA